ncbi:hypothetical protein CRENPOLYSF1_50070 [Crenothrix polyspora]|uniref:Uncharacterized protein n=1 Tax=Crenothrix polyspora TaxID=360316 RepID=A0A1R4HCQ5_9GAMM|nr:hypothetical protein CRENPOLYSF1_50070 [Crenothrix polyspora]
MRQFHGDNGNIGGMLGIVHINIWLFLWRYANVIRIIGAGYWRKGKAIYERENQVHK